MASLRRADIPVDGNGTTRNITRSVSPHQLHLAASEARDFAWVLHALWGGNKDGKPQVNVPDTVFFAEDGAPVAWFFTAADGSVKRKSSTKTSISGAVQRLQELAAAQGRSTAALLHSARGDVTLLNEGQLSVLLRGVPPMTVALQAFVAPRSGQEGAFASFESQYSIDANGREVMATYKVGAPGGAMAREGERLRSRDGRQNEALDQAARTVVRCMEAQGQCRVRRLILQFSVDRAGVPWLVRSVLAETVPRATSRARGRAPDATAALAPHRTHSPNLVQGMHLRSPDFDAASLATVSLQRSVFGDESPGGQAATGRPRHLASRLGEREARQSTLQSVTHSLAVSASRARMEAALERAGTAAEALLAPSPVHRGRSLSPAARARGEVAGSSDGGRGEGEAAIVASVTDAAGKAGSASELTALAADLLPSQLARRKRELTRSRRQAASQDSLPFPPASAASAPTAAGAESHPPDCPGDFCGLDSALLDPTTRHHRSRALGERQSRLGRPVSAAGMQRLMTAASAGLPDGATDTAHGRTDAQLTIQYGVIAQVRSEQELVGLLLRRVVAGEDPDYVMSDHAWTRLLGQAFPTQYYTPVAVCPNCFAVYSKVQHARRRALAKLGNASRRGSGPARAHSAITTAAGDAAVADAATGARRGHRPHTVAGLEAAASTSAAAAAAADASLRRARTMLPYESTVSAEHAAAAAAAAAAAPAAAWTDELSPEEEALQRAQRAIDALTKGDVAELRTFANPPPAVAMVSAAVMLLLTGEALSWGAAKRVMANGERFLGMLMALDKGRIPAARLRALEPFVRHESFQPHLVHPVSRPAAHFCAWVRGVAQYAAWQAGLPADQLQVFALREPLEVEAAVARQSSAATLQSASTTGELSAARASASSVPSLPPVRGSRTRGRRAPESFAEKLARRRRQLHRSARERGDGGDQRGDKQGKEGGGATGVQQGQGQALTVETQSEQVQGGELSTTGRWRPQRSLLSPTLVGFGRGDAHSPPRLRPPAARPPVVVTSSAASAVEAARRRVATGGARPPRASAAASAVSSAAVLAATSPAAVAAAAPASGELSRGRTRREQHLRRMVQQQQMARLHGTADTAAGADTTAGAMRTFECSDGLTSMPYTVMGAPDMGLEAPCFVVVHDFFDTLESSQIFLREVAKRHYGCQILLLNLPGQAFTTYNTGTTPAEQKYGAAASEVSLNNVFMADRLHELLERLDDDGAFVSSCRPFYVLGVGNGANVSAQFCARYGRAARYRESLRSLVLINGFAHVDAQLAAALHSAVSVFSCFPPDRPDLPVSYFARFLFSEQYLQRVDPAMALSIYTAVSNPITLDGRLRICRGALQHADLRPALSGLPVPLVLVQSTENALVSPAAVDAFLHGREVSHMWSHQLAAAGGLGAAGRQQVTQALARPDGAVVMWLRAGHEVRQEAKQQVLELLHALADVGAPERPQEVLPPTPAAPAAAAPAAATPKAAALTAAAPAASAATAKAAAAAAASAPATSAPAASTPSYAPPLSSYSAVASTYAGPGQFSPITRPADPLAIPSVTTLPPAPAALPRPLVSAAAPAAASAAAVALDSARESRLAATQAEFERAMAEHKRMQLAAAAERRAGEAATPALAAPAAPAAPASTHASAAAASTTATSAAVTTALAPAPSGTSAAPHASRRASDPVPAPASRGGAVAPSAAAAAATNPARSPLTRRQSLPASLAFVGDLERAESAAISIQSGFRGMQARALAQRLRDDFADFDRRTKAAVSIQAGARGFMARRRVARLRAQLEREEMETYCALLIQRAYRGYHGRLVARERRRERSVRVIQRAYRGSQARAHARQQRARRDQEQERTAAAAKLQATWRMRLQRDRFLDLRVKSLAATEVQRVYRGHLGRRRASRKQQWVAAAPGPARLSLGLRLIGESKEAFERQRQELSALHRAQERAEKRVSDIHAGLKESEAELVVLEEQLRDLDQLDNDLRELSKEREVLGRAPVEVTLDEATEGGKSKGGAGGGQAQRGAKSSELHQLEMALHLKRAERERKKRELEAEFASVFKQVGEKRAELATLERGLVEMEASRQRKDREFQRLQRNLMEMLEEQKQELDLLREKGLELETATATSAAAAAATAKAAQEHEQRSAAIFQGTEELLKFQFMSMSMSYFSSLNMLKNLRGMNDDASRSAVASAATTAAAAAAAAAAANLPTVKHLRIGDGALTAASTAERDRRRAAAEAERKRVEEAARFEFPERVQDWSVADVGRWLDSLSLPQYKRAFEEAAVDGDFLLALKPEDMRDVLGVEHELHVKKICFARDKLRPLSDQERAAKTVAETEARAAGNRGDAVPAGTLDPMEVFRACRNGRRRRVEEALEAGFDINAVDEHGNTLLLIAAQQVNRGMVEMLLDHGADVNHQNTKGNTALHFAMAYDAEGALGEYLVERGADDMLENQFGMSPYDGISPDE